METKKQNIIDSDHYRLDTMIFQQGQNMMHGGVQYITSQNYFFILHAIYPSTVEGIDVCLFLETEHQSR